MRDENEVRFRTAAELIHAAGALLITAGAGMGVDSGLPDFRGREGFWKAYPPLARRGLGFAQLASASLFVSDPRLAWGFYGHRLGLYRKTTPHAGFGLLLKWAAERRSGNFVFTSNADGQFQKAGFLDEHTMECHGSIHHLQCVGPCTPQIWPANEVEVEVDESTLLWQGALPNCDRCGRVARPNILMFGGDWGWLSTRRASREMTRTDWLKRALESKLVIIECGAGTAVPSVRSFSDDLVRNHGVKLIRINPLATIDAPGTVGIKLGALDALRAIDRYIP